MMRFSPIKPVLLAIFLAGAGAGASCGFIDLRPVEFEIDTSETADNGPVYVRFSSEMRREEAQNAVSVKSTNGYAEVDKSWEEDTLVLRPVPEWSPGVMYTVSVSGVLSTKDGREETAAKHRSFYSGDMRLIPFVTAYYPKDGVKTGVHAEDGALVRIVFSEPMETKSVEDALIIGGFTEKSFSWNSGKTAVNVRNGKNLEPFSKYSWSIKTTARSIDGYALAREVSAMWTTDRDTEKPAVLTIVPVMKREHPFGYDWVETGNSIETGLGNGDAVRVVFSKRMDTSSLYSAVRFDPPLAGRVEIINPEKILFIPERNAQTGVFYTLIISGETKDEYGLKLGEDYCTYFTPDIGYLTARQISVYNGVTAPVYVSSGDTGGNTADLAVSAVETTVSLSITFNEKFTQESALNLFDRIRLVKLFPSDAPIPQLIMENLLSVDQKTIQAKWSGFYDAYTHNHPHYYRVTIPGGQTGVVNGSGAYLQDDITVYLKTTIVP